jgi:hypothetical protein
MIRSVLPCVGGTFEVAWLKLSDLSGFWIA